MVEKIIFKDQVCDAKWKKKSLTCHKGTLVFASENVADFRLYRAWCAGCSRIRIVDRTELQNQFKKLAKTVRQVLKK
jgi:hypothetical protein